jgi:hypothetical protein
MNEELRVHFGRKSIIMQNQDEIALEARYAACNYYFTVFVQILFTHREQQFGSITIKICWN